MSTFIPEVSLMADLESVHLMISMKMILIRDLLSPETLHRIFTFDSERPVIIHFNN